MGISSDPTTSQTPECEQCGGRGFIYLTKDGVDGVAKCPHVAEAAAKRRTIVTFGEEYQASAKISDFEAQSDISVTQDGIAVFLPDVLRAYVQSCDSGDGMLVLGSVGAGKSHLASAIANALLQFNFRSLTFATVRPLIHDIRRAELCSTPQVQSPEYDRLMSAVQDCDLLVLDDLATEKATEYTESLLYGIVSERFGKRKPIIATCNTSLKTLEKYVGERVVDRLLGFCRGVPMLVEGKSRRWSALRKFRV